MSGSAEASGDRSIAAAGSIRQALTGDGAIAYYTERSLTLPPEALELPPQAPPHMVNLPERTGLFIGRQPELARLDEAFEDAGGVVVQAVHGLGGIGKSTLAAKWAAGRTGSYNPVWWITAETPDDLEAGLADLAVALQPALRDVLSRKARSERAVRWLAEHEGWLLVLDNVSNPADVRPLLGRTTGGRFLITTRRASGWQGIAEPLSLDVLELPQAVELFEQIHGGAAEGIEELCVELGCLPLAVEQAAAYCVEARITPRAYQDLLGRYPERVLASTAEGGDGEQTIARVWRVTMDRLADTPAAARILRVIAWWAPDGIPRAYVESLGDEPDITEALRRLAAHSMISLREDGTISVHRLVQAVSRAGEGRAEGREEAIRVLLDLAPQSLGSHAWAAQAESLIEHHGGDEKLPPDFTILIISAAMTRGAPFDPAIRLAASAAAKSEGSIRQRRATDLIRGQFVALYEWVHGDRRRAVTQSRMNVSMSRRVFGRDAPQTIDERTELAIRQAQIGLRHAGMSLAKKNARRAERVLGRDAPETLRAKGAMTEAWRLMAQSAPQQYAGRAATEIEQLLADAVRSGGESSGPALQHLWALVDVREAAGNLVGALRAAEECVEKHPVPPEGADVLGLQARHRVVLLHWKAGELQRARELAAPLLAELEEAFADGDKLGGRLRDALTPILTPADDT
ncbi:NB-ARC domain-containing protein [Streptomyces cyaneus]|uniref:NB-ARC domain-containing protein n=1 Tax=Streptomyces cyaneus TaxID=1904 RepID=UPI000FF8A735|nr:NB-ARC domain-containing protein [Streptomyces cyaneus]